MSNQLIRLSKRLSELGLCSRREADELIEAGFVFVDGQRVNILGSKVTLLNKIELHERAKEFLKKKATILLNKPIGYVSNLPEKGYKSAIELIRFENYVGPEDSKPKNLELKDMAPCGRLDIDSQGLIIFSQDGHLAKIIIGENSKVDKEYLVKIEGDLTQEKIEILCYGLTIDSAKLKRAEVTQIGPNSLKFILHEGKKRQIRRMCDQVKLKVTYLKRVRIGNIELSNLKTGHWRYLTEEEKEKFKNQYDASR